MDPYNEQIHRVDSMATKLEDLLAVVKETFPVTKDAHTGHDSQEVSDIADGVITGLEGSTSQIKAGLDAMETRKTRLSQSEADFDKRIKDAKVIFEACEDFQAAMDSLAANHRQEIIGLGSRITGMEAAHTSTVERKERNVYVGMESAHNDGRRARQTSQVQSPAIAGRAAKRQRAQASAGKRIHASSAEDNDSSGPSSSKRAGAIPPSGASSLLSSSTGPSSDPPPSSERTPPDSSRSSVSFRDPWPESVSSASESPFVKRRKRSGHTSQSLQSPPVPSKSAEKQQSSRGRERANQEKPSPRNDHGQYEPARSSGSNRTVAKGPLSASFDVTSDISDIWGQLILHGGIGIPDRKELARIMRGSEKKQSPTARPESLLSRCANSVVP
ncbi:MAG: hypothetical protein Q9184_007218, partial [Pyrenodesmia sp. 2 TL-2023]